jgi:hypothetical protein
MYKALGSITSIKKRKNKSVSNCPPTLLEKNNRGNPKNIQNKENNKNKRRNY